MSVFVQQEDLLFAQLTVKETLATAAALKTSDDANVVISTGDGNNNSTDTVVNKSILRLGLKKAADTRVGERCSAAF